MPSYNKIIMIGHLTREPKLSFLPSQTPVVEFGIATNYKYGDKEEVCFIDCRCFGKRAEAINKFFAKGRPILIEGRLTYDQWESQDGGKHSKHRITVDSFAFVDSKEGGTTESQPPAEVSQPSSPKTLPDDSDIPF